MENCILCGEPLLSEGICGNKHSLKKMCINCAFSKKNEDGTYTCVNEDNLNATREKMLEAIRGVSESYEVTDFAIQPLPLKKPLLKCKGWVLSDEALDEVIKLFV